MEETEIIDPRDVDDDPLPAQQEPLETEYATRNSASAVDVADLCREAWSKYTHRQPERSREAWLEATEEICVLCESEAEASYRVIADRFAWATEGVKLPDAGDEAWVWEAIVRLAVNLIMAEDNNEFDAARGHDWSEWIRKRINKEEVKDDHGDRDEGEGDPGEDGRGQTRREDPGAEDGEDEGD